MAELESRQKGFNVGYTLSTNSNTRAEMKSRLEAVTAAIGADWDFEPDGATDEEIKANFMLLSSADAACPFRFSTVTCAQVRVRIANAYI